MKIWKWKLDTVECQTIYLPLGAKILTVELQGEQLLLWALCDPLKPFEARHICIYDAPGSQATHTHDLIISLQLERTTRTFHVFESRK